MEKNKILEIKKLKVNFNTYAGKVEAIRKASLNVYENEILAIVGESGSGKSVITQAVLRLLPTPPAEVESGEILFRGQDLLKLSENEMRKVRGNKIGIIFQDAMTALNPTMKVGMQIIETIEQHQEETTFEAKRAIELCTEKLKDLDVNSKEYAFYKKRLDVAEEYLGNTKTSKERALELLELVRIPDAEKRMNQYIHQFSGGMRQRIMIAIALACNPNILIADEPTTALDVTIKAEIMDILAGLKDKFGTSIILITHDLGVVASKADRITVMYCGEVVESGLCEEIFKNPQHPYTKGLLNSIPRLDIESSERLQIIEGATPSPLQIPKGCAFYSRCPHAMKVCKLYPPQKSLAKDNHRYYCWLSDERAKKGVL